MYAKRRNQLNSNDDDDDNDSVYYNLPSLENSEKYSVIQPPREKIVQFGKDTRSSSLEQTRYGARESYSYSIPRFLLSSLKKKNLIVKVLDEFQRGVNGNAITKARTKSPSEKRSSTVKYTRYGECPPWYGPSKMCSLELVGRRIHTLRDAPPVAAKLASHIPGFASVNVSLGADLDRIDNDNTENEAKVISAIKWFKKDTLDIANIEDGYSLSNSPPHEIQTKMNKILRSLKAATRFITMQ